MMMMTIMNLDGTRMTDNMENDNDNEEPTRTCMAVDMENDKDDNEY